MPPPPKPDGERRRRNVESRWSVLQPQPDAVVPVLPSHPAGVAWSARSRAEWAKAWRSPMSARWQDADVEGLVRLFALRQDFAVMARRALRNPDAAYPLAMLGPIKDLEDRFLLSDKARQLARVAVADRSVVDGAGGLAVVRPISRRMAAVDDGVSGAVAGS
jgi:hypothetical protein